MAHVTRHTSHVTWHTSHVTQADINAVNLNGNAALHFAYAYKLERRTRHTSRVTRHASHVTLRAIARFQKVVDYLISHGADVSIVNCKCVASHTSHVTRHTSHVMLLQGTGAARNRFQLISAASFQISQLFCMVSPVNIAHALTYCKTMSFI
jgi:hypothetical protein